MKKIFFAIFLIHSALLLQAQDDGPKPGSDSVEVNLIRLPDSTAIAIPNGKLITKEIGAAGGAIISDDGKIELIFPEGALLKNTSVSIQPTENLLPNGNKAYHFEPSGMQFLKPVQVIFHYSDEEAETCPPEFKFMALQDHNGKWEYMDYEDWDSASKSLKGYTKHFSAFVDGNIVELNDTELTLKVGQTYMFFLDVVHPPPPTEPGEEELAYLPQGVKKVNRGAAWKVNGKVGGSVKHGTISPIQGELIQAIYKAPPVLTSDPIKVNLSLYTTKIREVVQHSRKARGWKGITRIPTTTLQATFTCKVKLYDQYKVSVIFNKDDGSSLLIDSANFIVTVYKDKGEITEIINYPPFVKMADPYGLESKVIIDKSCVGIINISATDIKKYNLSRDNPPEILFEMRSKKVLIYKFQYIAKNKYFKTTPVTDIILDSEPVELNFIANGHRQSVSYFPNAYKIIVDPFR